MHRSISLPTVRRQTGLILAMSCCCTLLSSSVVLAQTPKTRFPYLARFPHFNPTFVLGAPGDIDVSLKDNLADNGDFILEQREFELYAWQLFLSLNATELMSAPLSLSSGSITGAARWEKWETAAHLSDIGKSSITNVNACRASVAAAKPGETGRRSAARELRSVSTMSPDDIVTATRDPTMFNAPVVDQAGNFVFYETVIDPNQKEYICYNQLYSPDGQKALASEAGGISFPEGTEDMDGSGSYTLKLAWKVLDPSRGDDPRRYYSDPARVLDLGPEGKAVWRTVEVGLVGMHIVHKTKSAPERIWATFEHVDNLAVDRIAEAKLRPSFYNPDCPLCDQNRPPLASNWRTPTQVARTVPISAETNALNNEVRTALSAKSSLWQYYKLVGVQWLGIPGDLTSATPSVLSNPIMETYFQPIPIKLDADGSKRSVKEAAVKLENKGLVASREDCVTCHEHARIAESVASHIYSRSQSADFSWFLSDHVR